MDNSLSQMLDDNITVTLSDETGTYSLGPNVTIGSGFLDPNYGAVPTVTLSPGSTYSNSISATSYPYTITGGTGITNPWATTASPKIRLDGPEADIEVNGESLIAMIKRVEERLNILTPNEKLEAEWEELRALGNKYRELEQHIKDKQATWDRLKAMPPPPIE